MSGVQTIQVGPEDNGLRLDRWFKRHFPELSHACLEKLLRTGQVRVDGRRARAGLRLAAGQTIRVPPIPEAVPPQPPPRHPRVDPKAAAALRGAVLHRDDDVLAINKPPGLAVQGGSRITQHLDAMLEALSFEAGERPRLVHRLDKDTSGVLLLARNAGAAAKLGAALRARKARKVYWALVVGVPRPRRGRIDSSLAKRPGRGGERVAADERTGKRAVTFYRVIKAAGQRAAWLALMPVTGRTHQLRAHAALLGTPILGDGKYGGKAAFLAGLKAARRLHLHARAIALPHPRGGELKVVAPLPEHMLESWRFFGFDPEDDGDPFAMVGQGTNKGFGL